MLTFGLTEAPKLTKDNLNPEAVATFIVHIRNLIRANAFDDSVMQQLMDSARLHPIENHWTEGAGRDVPNATCVNVE